MWGAKRLQVSSEQLWHALAERRTTMTKRLAGTDGFTRRRALGSAAFALAATAAWAALHAASPSASDTTAADVGTSLLTVPRLLPVSAQHGLPLPPAVREAAVDALSAVVARKYRVSHDASRIMIGTAFREARMNGIDPVLVVAVMAVESRFNPIAQSERGAMGLMQVTPRFHSDKLSTDGEESIFDPRVNIRLGARVLKEYIQRGGNELAGLQLYNGSASDPSNAYAGKVMAERQRLQDAINRVRIDERSVNRKQRARGHGDVLDPHVGDMGENAVEDVIAVAKVRMK